MTGYKAAGNRQLTTGSWQLAKIYQEKIAYSRLVQG